MEDADAESAVEPNAGASKHLQAGGDVDAGVTDDGLNEQQTTSEGDGGGDAQTEIEHGVGVDGVGHSEEGTGVSLKGEIAVECVEESKDEGDIEDGDMGGTHNPEDNQESGGEQTPHVDREEMPEDKPVSEKIENELGSGENRENEMSSKVTTVSFASEVQILNEDEIDDEWRDNEDNAPVEDDAAPQEEGQDAITKGEGPMPIDKRTDEATTEHAEGSIELDTNVESVAAEKESADISGGDAAQRPEDEDADSAVGVAPAESGTFEDGAVSEGQPQVTENSMTRVEGETENDDGNNIATNEQSDLPPDQCENQVLSHSVAETEVAGATHNGDVVENDVTSRQLHEDLEGTGNDVAEDGEGEDIAATVEVVVTGEEGDVVVQTTADIATPEMEPPAKEEQAANSPESQEAVADSQDVEADLKVPDDTGEGGEEGEEHHEIDAVSRAQEQKNEVFTGEDQHDLSDNLSAVNAQGDEESRMSEHQDMDKDPAEVCDVNGANNSDDYQQDSNDANIAPNGSTEKQPHEANDASSRDPNLELESLAYSNEEPLQMATHMDPLPPIESEIIEEGVRRGIDGRSPVELDTLQSHASFTTPSRSPHHPHHYQHVHPQHRQHQGSRTDSKLDSMASRATNLSRVQIARIPSPPPRVKAQMRADEERRASTRLSNRLPPSVMKMSSVMVSARKRAVKNRQASVYYEERQFEKVITLDEAINSRPPMPFDLDTPGPCTYTPRNKPLYEDNAPEYTFGMKFPERAGGGRTAYAKTWFNSPNNYTAKTRFERRWPSPNAYGSGRSMVGRKMPGKKDYPHFSIGVRTKFTINKQGSEHEPGPDRYHPQRSDALLYRRAPAFSMGTRLDRVRLFGAPEVTPAPNYYNPLVTNTSRKTTFPAFTISGVRKPKSHALGPHATL